MPNIDKLIERAHASQAERFGRTTAPAEAAPDGSAEIAAYQALNETLDQTNHAIRQAESDYRALEMLENIPRTDYATRERFLIEHGDEIKRARKAREAADLAANAAMLKQKQAEIEQQRAQTAAAAEAQRAATEAANAVLAANFTPDEQKIVDTYLRLKAQGRDIAAAGVWGIHHELLTRAARLTRR